jgi:hypothetical protein
MTGSLVKKNNYGSASWVFFAQLCVYFFAISAVKTNRKERRGSERNFPIG